MPNLSSATLEIMKKVMSGKTGQLKPETPKRSKSPMRNQDISIH
jgi:hypothetical protein